MAITAKKILKAARNIVTTSNLSKGDSVAIVGGAHTMVLLEEIALESYRKGAIPTIVVTSDRYLKRVYDEIPASTLGIVPKGLVGLAKASDMIIAVEEYENPRIREGFPRAKLKAKQKANLPINKLMSDPKSGKKWLYAGWPTPAAASRWGVSYPEFEEIVLGGMSVPPETLKRVGRTMERKVRGAAWVHAWDSKGTDFRVKVSGRFINIDDGIISKQDYDRGDRGANLPAGELFIAPVETEGGGTLFCPLTQDRMTDVLVRDVMIEFEDGVLQLDKVRASKNKSSLVSSFRQCEEIDKTRYKPVRTRNVAELGIGLNPRIKKATGYILTDEKITGTVHLAFGLNKGYGGKSESTMHWDFVTAPGINVEVESRDGTSKMVIDKGRLV